MVSRTKTKVLKKARSREQETVVAAKQIVLCSVRAAFGRLQTRSRKNEIWEASGPGLISDLEIQKASGVGLCYPQ